MGGISVGGAGGISPSATWIPTQKYSAGNGGVNTGGGGGGCWNTGSSFGGSGIVVIAIPQTPITNNMNAVLPSALAATSQYNAILNSPTLSTTAYNSIRAAFACKLLNYNYFGPIMNLRSSIDTSGTYTQPFYADVCGNLGTGYLATGLSVNAWLTAAGANTTYAFVTKWYDQGMDTSFNCAYQHVPWVQPVYDVVNGMINFGYLSGVGGNIQSGCFFYMSNGAYTYGDSSFSYITRLNNLQSGASNMIMGVGGVTAANNNAMYMDVITNSNVSSLVGQITNSTNSFTPGSSYTLTYDNKAGASTRVATIYYNTNGTEVQTSSGNPSAALTLSSSYNFLGAGNSTSTGGSYPSGTQLLNGQMYSFLAFNTALVSSDRVFLETIPYLPPTTPATISGLTMSNITATNFTLSWTAVGSASYYLLFVNGSYYGTVINSSTITPTIVGPWTCTLYAYNATNLLLAKNTVTHPGAFSMVLNLPYTPVIVVTGIPFSGTMSGVAVSSAQDRMLVQTANGLYYMTSSNSGASWTSPTAISGLIATSNGNVWLSQDGTKGVVMGVANGLYSIYWPAGTGQVPTCTLLTYTQSFNYVQLSGKADGSVAVLNNYGGNGIFYLTWNYVTNVYSTPTIFSYSNTSLTYTPQVGGIISPDGLTLLVTQCPNNTNFSGYISLTWSTTTPPVPTLNSYWLPTGVASGQGTAYINCGNGTDPQWWGGLFVGGTATTPPTYVVTAQPNSYLGIHPWHNQSKTLMPGFNLLPSFYNPQTLGCYVGGMAAAGPKGNVIYFPYMPTGTAANTISIGTFTLNVNLL